MDYIFIQFFGQFVCFDIVGEVIFIVVFGMLFQCLYGIVYNLCGFFSVIQINFNVNVRNLYKKV